MRHYLVVAGQTLLGDPSLPRVRDCPPTGPCPFHVVMPSQVARGAVSTAGHERPAAERLKEALELPMSVVAGRDAA